MIIWLIITFHRFAQHVQPAENCLFFLNSQDKPKIAFGKKTFYGLNNQ